MNDDFPIPEVDRLPKRITPCPILEAILEIRFVTDEDWSVLPGLLYTEIRGKYGEAEALPLSEFPAPLRESRPELIHKPLVKFAGPHGFAIHLGPRVFSLVSNDTYPGWQTVRTEMEWLIAKLESAGFVTEGERLGMRYIDFFEEDIFEVLRMETQINGQVLTGSEMTLARIFRKGPFTARLMLNNRASVLKDDESRSGSLFDLDIRLDAGEFDLFENGLARFGDAHDLNKAMFFGLLKPDFLGTLSPEYE